MKPESPKASGRTPGTMGQQIDTEAAGAERLKAALRISTILEKLGVEVIPKLPRVLLLAAYSLKARGRVCLADAIALDPGNSLGPRLGTAGHHELDARGAR